MMTSHGSDNRKYREGRKSRVLDGRSQLRRSGEIPQGVMFEPDLKGRRGDMQGRGRCTGRRNKLYGNLKQESERWDLEAGNPTAPFPPLGRVC